MYDFLSRGLISNAKLAQFFHSNNRAKILLRFSVARVQLCNKTNTANLAHKYSQNQKYSQITGRFSTEVEAKNSGNAEDLVSRIHVGPVVEAVGGFQHEECNCSK